MFNSSHAFSIGIDILTIVVPKITPASARHQTAQAVSKLVSTGSLDEKCKNLAICLHFRKKKTIRRNEFIAIILDC